MGISNRLSRYDELGGQDAGLDFLEWKGSEVFSIEVCEVLPNTTRVQVPTTSLMG